MKPFIIGIIGATGKMGQAFAQLFRSRGFEVLEADLRTELKPSELIQKSDITLFSVPITVAPALMTELAPQAKEGALLTDVTAIKTPAVQAMLEHAPESCEVLGLHPVFGPGVVDEMSHQIIAACPARKGEKTSFLLDFFQKEGAQIKETTPEEHDRMMSIIQGLTHISSIATAMAIKSLGVDLSKSFDFSSPVYRLRLEMVGRVLSQNPQVYSEIAVENPLTKESLKAYQGAVKLLADYVERGDEEGFMQSFREAADFLGDFKDEAYQKTSELIKRSKDIL